MLLLRILLPFAILIGTASRSRLLYHSIRYGNETFMAHNPLRRSEERQSLERQAAFEDEVAFALTVTPFLIKRT